MDEESAYEEQRTTPDSQDEPIWGERRGDRFFPVVTAYHLALIEGWPLNKCGANVSPDGSVLIEETEEGI